MPHNHTMEQSQPDFGNLLVRVAEVCKVNCDSMLLETGEASTMQGCMEAQGPWTLERGMTPSKTDVVKGKATAEPNTLGHFSVDAYEPLRLFKDFGPPKRFYRTFWRSVASRIMEHERLRMRKEQA